MTQIIHGQIASSMLRVHQTLGEAIALIRGNSHGLCVVVDIERRILGTITDGDCRRALLRGLTTDSLVTEVMNSHFLAVTEMFTPEQLLALMRTNEVRQIPVVDSHKRLTRIVSRDEFTTDSTKIAPDVHVLILAGGKGTRLAPLTKDKPKPMLPVAGKAIVERIVESLVTSGFTNISMSVNYLAAQIEEHFKDGSAFGAKISYLHEDRELGTGGPLGLLPDGIGDKVLVVNGDLLTTLDYRALVDFHEESENEISLCMSEHKVQIPYGIVSFDPAGNFQGISEKPTLSYPVNSGVYVLSTDLKRLVPPQTFFPITYLIERAVKEGCKIGVFPIHERWNDIGLLPQYLAVQSSVDSR